MPDVTLKKGKLEVTFDFENVTIKEFRLMFDPEQSQVEDDKTVAKVAGITVEELESLSHPDYKRLIKAFLEKSKAPLDDEKN